MRRSSQARSRDKPNLTQFINCVHGGMFACDIKKDSNAQCPNNCPYFEDTSKK